jgi:excisionase family DNA binding protein
MTEQRVALTLPETARALGVSKATVYRLPGLPIVRLGPRLTRVPTRDLERWLSAQAEPAQPAEASRA